ncbi:MAG: hypothetical protein AAGA54_18070 [Myxococcota bacterium]
MHRSLFLTLALLTACGDDSTSAMPPEDTDGGASTSSADPTGPDASSTTQAGDTTEAPPDDDGDDPSGTDTSDEPPPPPTSPTANVRFKGPARIEADLASVLQLDPQTLCTEVGGASCTRDVHNVALGGVSPYDLGIHTPPALSATAPIAVERVALQACIQRIDLDLDAAGPVLFDVPLLPGDTADVGAPEATAFIDALYTRGLLRHATDAEVEALLLMHADVATSSSDAPGRDWGAATCVAVLTTTEFLFY